MSPPRSNSSCPSSEAAREQDSRPRARHPGRDRRLRRYRRPRLQYCRRRDVRLSARVGDPDRRPRDHRLLGDVRACGRCVGQGGLRRHPRAGRLQGRAGRARLVRGRQPDDARLRDRWRRDRVAASLGASLPLVDPDRRDRIRGDHLGDIV